MQPCLAKDGNNSWLISKAITGGRGFSGNAERQSRIMGNNETEIKWFHQSGNKEVRIFTRSAEVMNLTYMPEGWEVLFPQFYAETKSFRKFGKNAHDDGGRCSYRNRRKRGDFEYDSYEAATVAFSGIPIVKYIHCLMGVFCMQKRMLYMIQYMWTMRI